MRAQRSGAIVNLTSMGGRASFAGGALQHPPALPAYADITGSLRADLPATDGSQPGDPAKAADAILQALASDKTPLRLALGNDAANMIAAYLDDSRAEFSAGEHVTRSTDYNAQ
jgi:hypothetical protein